MAKTNYLVQIKQRMVEIQKEFNALTEAYQLLSSAGATRGRKAKLPSLSEIASETVVAAAPKKKGKKGRPAGSKNKAKGAKRGPKPSVKAAVNKPAPAEMPAKSKAAKSAKPAKAAKKVKSAKPVKAAKATKSGKRSRIPNLSNKIQEMVGKSGRFMTNSQITDRLASLYPSKSRSDLGKYISVILANMKSRKELAVVTIDAKGNKMRSGLWGLTSWFDGGKPKNEFLK